MLIRSELVDGLISVEKILRRPREHVVYTKNKHLIPLWNISLCSNICSYIVALAHTYYLGKSTMFCFICHGYVSWVTFLNVCFLVMLNSIFNGHLLSMLEVYILFKKLCQIVSWPTGQNNNKKKFLDPSVYYFISPK
jgi:hypothetical protein